MNRILSGDEQSKYYSDIWQRHDTDGLLKAQLLKTDKEWAEWIEKTFEITKVCTDCVIGTKSCISRWCTYRNWQERKKALEASNG